jgi:hypothetical protein
MAKERLSPLSAALLATEIMDQIERGDAAARADLVLLVGQQLPVENETFASVVAGLARWAMANTAASARHELAGALAPIITWSIDLAMRNGMRDPAKIFKTVAKSQVRRAALVQLMGMDVMAAADPAKRASMLDSFGKLFDIDPALLTPITSTFGAGVPIGTSLAMPVQPPQLPQRLPVSSLVQPAMAVIGRGVPTAPDGGHGSIWTTIFHEKHPYKIMLDVAGKHRGMVHVFDEDLTKPPSQHVVMSGAWFDFASSVSLKRVDDDPATTYDAWDDAMLPVVSETVRKLWEEHIKP